MFYGFKAVLHFIMKSLHNDICCTKLSNPEPPPEPTCLIQVWMNLGFHFLPFPFWTPAKPRLTFALTKQRQWKECEKAIVNGKAGSVCSVRNGNFFSDAALVFIMSNLFHTWAKLFVTARSSGQMLRPSFRPGRRFSTFGMHLLQKYVFNLSRWVHLLWREWHEHSGRDAKVQRGMLDIKQRSGALDWRFSANAVCVFPAEDSQKRRQAEWETVLSSEPSSIYAFLSHQKTFVMLIELKVQRRVQPSACALMRAWASAQVWTITSNVLIRARCFVHGACTLTIIPSLWKAYSYKHIQTSPPGSKVTPQHLSVASPVCLSFLPFHHSAIFLSICLHSSPIVRQKL